MSSALERLKQQRREQHAADAKPGPASNVRTGSAGATAQQATTHLACNTTRDNEAYMQRFEEVLKLAGCRDKGRGCTGSADGPLVRSGAEFKIPSGRAAVDARTPLPAGRSEPTDERDGGRGPKNSSYARAAVPPWRRTTPQPRDNGCPPCGQRQQLQSPAWRTGPLDAAGRVCQLSERPLLCLAARWDPGGGGGEVVIGSSDHALYVLDVKSCTRRRTLYSKTCGHKEWVTTVTWLDGGRILSGGMDGTLWLWPSGGWSSGTELKGHAGAVSQVRALPGASVALSSSYDGTVRLWDVSRPRASQRCVLAAGRAPVLDLACTGAGTRGGGTSVEPEKVAGGSIAVAAGDRRGSLYCWDLTAAGESAQSERSQPLWRCANAHQGHVTALAWVAGRLTGTAGANDGSGGGGGSSGGGGGGDAVLLSGGQDGCVRAWDLRAPGQGAVMGSQVHASPKGTGAVGSIVQAFTSSGSRIVTAGADGQLAVLDPRASLTPLHSVRLSDFPYSLTVTSTGLALCGCGDGTVHTVDVESGETLYALGANKAAVRGIEVGPDALVCCGDDGTAITYQFSS